MPKGLPQNLGTWMAQVERKLDNLSSGNRLDHASLDGTTLYLKGDGELGRIGRQPDGSNGVHIAKVQPPPQLTAAILTVGEQAGTCLVEWDGRTFDGRRMPLIHGHTEIWAELVGEDWSPTVAPGDAAKRVGTIRDRTGGEVVVALPQAGTWAVWLRAMGADRETAGPWSPVAQVEITPLVDTEAIEAELEDARDRITEADERLTAGQAALTTNLEDLNTRVGPALDRSISEAVSEAQNAVDAFRDEWDENWDPEAMGRLEARQETLEGDLVTGLSDVHDFAEQQAQAARDDAVNQAAANAQSEYDRLQEIAERALSRAGDNVLEDPSFETQHWVDEWNGTGDRLVRTNSPARTGDVSLIIEDGNATDFNFPDVDVELNQTYRLTIWYRTWPSNLADLSDGESALVIYDSDTNAELAVSEPLTVGSEFRRAQVAYQVPDSVQSIRPAIRASWPTGIVLFDDVSFQEVGAAAEALRMAEVARQQAEAAHIAAGNAVDAAANAYDAASSKSTVHWSLSAPSGTADNTDDVWWRYELRNGRRVVTGQWFWDDGVWRETEIAEEWLPLVNIGTGTYGDMSGDRLEANSVKAGKLSVVPDGRDLAPDLVDYADLWSLGSQVSITSSNVAESGLAFRVSGGAGSASGRAYGPWIPVREGDTIYYRVGVGNYTRVPDGQLRIYLLYNGSLTSWTRLHRVSSTGTYEGHYTVPRDGTTKVAFGVTIDSSATNGGDWAVRDFDVRVATKGVHITPQGIKSPQVDTAELTASSAFLDNAMVNLIQGRMANFDEALIGGTLLKDGAISASKLTIIPDTEDFAPDPSEFPELWDLQGATLISNSHSENPSGLSFSFGRGTGTTQIRGPLRPVTQGQQAYFKGRYGFNNGNTTANIQVRMEWYATPEMTISNRLSFDTFVTIPSGSSAQDFEGTVTVPEGAAYANLYLYQVSTTGGNGAINGTIQCHPIAEGKLIVKGLLQATTAELQELFFDTAVGNAIWAEAVRSRLVESQGIITEDMIATGAITTPKLTVTEELVAQIASFIRVEAGSLASNDIEAMRIVSSLIEATTYLIHNADGDVSVRLDGMNNFIAGELNTFATPAERDAQLGPNVTLGTSASTISPPIDWRREQDGWVPTPGAWKLDEIDFSNQPADDPQRLHIHPDLQGMFSRYELIVRAGVVEGSDVRALMVIVNDEYGSGYERYRWAARAERADGTVDAHSSEDAGTHPRIGYVGRYEGHLQVNLTTPGYGPRGYLTWETNGWANAGAGGGGWLIRSGGRWSAPNQVRVPITHFGVRPATGAGRTWAENASAELWGYR